MKHIVYIAVISIICCFLCACDPGEYSIAREKLNDVISVELIKYENPKQKHFASWVPDHFERLKSFDITQATILETLPAENVTSFLDLLSEKYILYQYYAYDSPKDICIRLNYSNGNFLIIWANYAESSFAGYIGEYLSDGTVCSFFGSFSSLSYFEELVDQCFAYELK